MQAEAGVGKEGFMQAAFYSVTSHDGQGRTELTVARCQGES